MRTAETNGPGQQHIRLTSDEYAIVFREISADTRIPIAAIGKALHAASSIQNHTVRSRREAFLRECWADLGSTQQQHVSVHCTAVAAMAGRLARLQGYSEAEVSRLRLAGLLHDIGKCLIPEALLAKPAKLTAAERAVMNRHSALGAAIAAALGADRKTRDLIEHHHTSPNALNTEGGTRGVALLCVADALVSMLTDRPYCAARSERQALAELRRCSHRQFDAKAVDLVHQMYRCSAAAA